jgi:hypothetical protein
MFNGRRQPSRGGKSRMMREYQVRFCERLGVKFPGPTRQKPALPRRSIAVRFTLISRPRQDGFNTTLACTGRSGRLFYMQVQLTHQFAVSLVVLSHEE